jgi:hypothetical protein
MKSNDQSYPAAVIVIVQTDVIWNEHQMPTNCWLMEMLVEANLRSSTGDGADDVNT